MDAVLAAVGSESGPKLGAAVWAALNLVNGGAPVTDALVSALKRSVLDNDAHPAYRMLSYEILWNAPHSNVAAWSALYAAALADSAESSSDDAVNCAVRTMAALPLSMLLELLHTDDVDKKLAGLIGKERGVSTRIGAIRQLPRLMTRVWVGVGLGILDTRVYDAHVDRQRAVTDAQIRVMGVFKAVCNACEDPDYRVCGAAFAALDGLFAEHDSLEMTNNDEIIGSADLCSLNITAEEVYLGCRPDPARLASEMSELLRGVTKQLCPRFNLLKAQLSSLTVDHHAAAARVLTRLVHHMMAARTGANGEVPMLRLEHLPTPVMVQCVLVASAWAHDHLVPMLDSPKPEMALTACRGLLMLSQHEAFSPVCAEWATAVLNVCLVFLYRADMRGMYDVWAELAVNTCQWLSADQLKWVAPRLLVALYSVMHTETRVRHLTKLCTIVTFAALAESSVAAAAPANAPVEIAPAVDADAEGAMGYVAGSMERMLRDPAVSQLWKDSPEGAVYRREIVVVLAATLQASLARRLAMMGGALAKISMNARNDWAREAIGVVSTELRYTTLSSSPLPQYVGGPLVGLISRIVHLRMVCGSRFQHESGFIELMEFAAQLVLTSEPLTVETTTRVVAQLRWQILWLLAVCLAPSPELRDLIKKLRNHIVPPFQTSGEPVQSRLGKKLGSTAVVPNFHAPHAASALLMLYVIGLRSMGQRQEIINQLHFIVCHAQVPGYLRDRARTMVMALLVQGPVEAIGLPSRVPEPTHREMLNASSGRFHEQLQAEWAAVSGMVSSATWARGFVEALTAAVDMASPAFAPVSPAATSASDAQLSSNDYITVVTSACERHVLAAAASGAATLAAPPAKTSAQLEEAGSEAANPLTPLEALAEVTTEVSGSSDPIRVTMSHVPVLGRVPRVTVKVVVENVTPVAIDGLSLVMGLEGPVKADAVGASMAALKASAGRPLPPHESWTWILPLRITGFGAIRFAVTAIIAGMNEEPGAIPTIPDAPKWYDGVDNDDDPGESGMLPLSMDEVEFQLAPATLLPVSNTPVETKADGDDEPPMAADERTYRFEIRCELYPMSLLHLCIPASSGASNHVSLDWFRATWCSCPHAAYFQAQSHDVDATASAVPIALSGTTHPMTAVQAATLGVECGARPTVAWFLSCFRSRSAGAGLAPVAVPAPNVPGLAVLCFAGKTVEGQMVLISVFGILLKADNGTQRWLARLELRTTAAPTLQFLVDRTDLWFPYFTRGQLKLIPGMTTLEQVVDSHACDVATGNGLFSQNAAGSAGVSAGLTLAQVFGRWKLRQQGATAQAAGLDLMESLLS